jgi:hypothetical protein
MIWSETGLSVCLVHGLKRGWIWEKSSAGRRRCHAGRALSATIAIVSAGLGSAGVSPVWLGVPPDHPETFAVLSPPKCVARPTVQHASP